VFASIPSCHEHFGSLFLHYTMRITLHYLCKKTIPIGHVGKPCGVDKNAYYVRIWIVC